MNAQVQELLKALGIVAPPQRKAKKAKGKRVPLTDEMKAAYKVKNAAECIKVFTAAGYADVQPYVNVLPYGGGRTPGWLEQGRKVKAGEKAVRVNGYPLFHEDQTEEIAAIQVAV
jgi:hypothetical protein